MPSAGLEDSGSEAEILPFPTLPLLRGYVSRVRKSIDDPSLQGSQIDFLMLNIVAVFDALRGADNTIATLTSELKSIKKAHSQLQIHCNHAHDNNVWLDKRCKETREANADLILVNARLESKFSVASTTENRLLQRVACMERAIHKLSALIIEKRIGPYKVIQSWVDSSFPVLGKTTRGCGDGHSAESCSQDQDMAGMAVGDSVSLGPHKLWDDAFIIADPESTTALANGDGAVSKAPSVTPSVTPSVAPSVAPSEAPSEVHSELSVLTNAIKFKMVQNRVSREMRAAADESAAVCQKQSTTHTSEAKNEPEHVNNTKPVEESVVVKEPVSQAPVKSKPKYWPPANHSTFPAAKVIQEIPMLQTVNTRQDRTRYADIARGPEGTPAYADSINPQVVVADPDEVAGDWNDVPVPIELRRFKAPAPPCPKTHERNVYMVGLPPTITVPMLATFIRGGKIESIIIVDEGKKGGVQSAIISFFSRRAARRLTEWMLESPRLVIDRHIARPVLSMALPPPMVPSGGGSRVVIINKIPLEIKTDEEFWNFVHKVAKKYTFKIGVQETCIWLVDEADEKKGFAGVVTFDTYHMGVEMSKIFRQRLRLDTKWGHDRCEEKLVSEKFYEFVEYKKKKQYEGESD